MHHWRGDRGPPVGTRSCTALLLKPFGGPARRAQSPMRRKLLGAEIQDTRYPGPARRRLEGASGASNSASREVPDHVLPLDESLGRDWALGKISSKQVVDYCGGAALLGARSEGVDKFARCASWGSHGQNAQRDLMTR